MRTSASSLIFLLITGLIAVQSAEDSVRYLGGPGGYGVFGDQLPADRPLPPVEFLELTLVPGEVTGNQEANEQWTLAPGVEWTLHLYSREGRITGGYASQAGSPLPRKLHATELVREARGLDGTVLVLHYNGENPFPGARFPIELTVRQTGERFTGTFTYRGATGRGRAWTVTGKVDGRVLPAAELQSPQRSLAAGWPCWQGPEGNGTAIASDRPLVERYADARLAWKSEAFIFALSGKVIMQAHNSPIVADGLVFIHNTEPNPEGPHTRPPGRAEDGKFKGWLYPDEFGHALCFSCFFDDVVHAIDARTGATVWKRRWARAGLNDGGKNKSGIFCTPIHHQGRLYVQRLMGLLTCLDAKTGETVWEVSLEPGRTERWREQAPLLAEGKTSYGALWDGRSGPGGAEIQASHALVGGVLVCSTRLGGDLLGLDPASGAILWQAKGVREGYAAPTRWIHRGKEFVLTGRALLQPQDGTVLWTIGGRFGGGPTASGGFLLVQNPFSVYRITPDKAEPVWALQPSEDDKAAWLAANKGGNPNEYSPYGNVDWTTSVASGDTFFMPARRGASWSVRREGEEWKAVRYGQDRYGRELTGTGVPIRDGDQVFCPMECRGPKMLRWDAASGDLTILDHSLDTDNAMCTSPAMADGRLFIRSQDGVVCIDLRQPAR